MFEPRRLAIIFGLVALVSCRGEPESLRLVTPVTPIDRSVLEDLGELLQGQVRVSLELSEVPMSEAAALDAVASGAADLAVVSNNMPFRDDVATVLPLYPAVLHVAHRADAATLPGPGLLRDKRIYAGPEGSASRLVFSKILERFGLGDSDFEYVTGPDDSPDVVVVFAPVVPERVADFPGFTLASLGSPGEIGTGASAIDTAVLLNPQFRPFVIPVGTYGEVTPAPVATIAVDRVLVTRRSLDSAVVYDLINEILRLRPALAAQHPGLFEGLSGDFSADGSRFIVHAGTQAYMQRSAPTISERYSGVAEVVVTVIVALSSATFAGVRIYQRRRKNRIDRFYSKTLELSRSINEDSSAAERREAIDAVLTLQTEAFGLLVDERLAADESFRIFITLSNDVLRRLGASDSGSPLSDS
jgi:hypothetical protein